MKSQIERAINFIGKQQRKDGGWWSWSSDNKSNFDKIKKYNSVFPTALILECLNSVENCEGIKKLAADFLMKQKSEFWSFNYWKRNSEENKIMPYPDDLDDTFCSLVALYNYNPKLIDGKALAKIVTLLTAVEKKVGGPYKTWLVSKEAGEIWKDIDLAVNSNVAYFLKLQEINLNNIDKLIKSAIDEGKIESPYYPSIYPVAYFISRFFRSEKLAKIILKKRKNGHWENPLNTALAINTLLNLKIDKKKLEPSVEYLIKNQNRNGSWKADAFCIDPAINRKIYYAGSDTLTTALTIEALNRYAKTNQTEKDETADRLHNKILKNVKKIVKNVGGIPEKNIKTEITLLPYYFWKSLGKNGEKIDENFIIRCGEANLLGWIAYTIYDDFYDNEGNRKMLPMANICLRELAHIYNSILPRTDFDRVFNEVMNELEEANLWEINNCYDDNELTEYGDYLQLAKKSLGHALGPVAILYKLGFDKNSDEVRNVFGFFKNYLIAKQLNDDAHDWEEDLKRGFINPVTREILKKTKTRSDFKKIFYEEIIVDVSNIVLENIREARKKIKKINIIENQKMILDILKKTEKSATKAIYEQKQALVFIDNYGK